MIYHITTKASWDEAKRLRFYDSDSLKKDGFIHCSSRNQLWLVATFLYKGLQDMIILCIDESKVTAKVVFEDLKGHGEYPHIYGRLNLESIVKVCDLPLHSDGNFKLPSDLI